MEVGIKRLWKELSLFSLATMFISLQVSSTALVQNKEYGGLCSLYHNYIYIYLKQLDLKKNKKQPPQNLKDL